jgi:GNAT superfamily N-acetyltransferase
LFRDDERVEIATVAERPELIELGWELTRGTLPEYNNHGDVLNRYWGRLAEERPDFQFHLLADGDLVARARSIPLRWDGSVDDLPVGIDHAIARGFDEAGANALWALVIMVPRDVQGRGVSAAAVKAMAEIARRHGLGSLIAPARPSWKERYPLVPIEALGPVAAAGQPVVRPVDARPRAAWRGSAQASAAISSDHGQYRRVGAVDGDVVPGERRLLVPRRPRHAVDRPRQRHRRLLGAERVDEAHALNRAGDRVMTPLSPEAERGQLSDRRAGLPKSVMSGSP